MVVIANNGEVLQELAHLLGGATLALRVTVSLSQVAIFLPSLDLGLSYGSASFVEKATIKSA